jgi:NAD(P)-dependent dehydrogenase (short-subunit alcohol dehydrogenase family)
MHLEKSHGSIIAVSSISSQLRIPAGSDYCVSKHALTRFMEFIPMGKCLYVFWMALH